MAADEGSGGMWRKTHHRLVGVGLGFLLVGLAHPESAWSCTCAGALPARLELRQSDAVFVGRPTAMRSWGPLLVYDFDVYQAWKGVTTRTVSVRC